MASKHCSLCNNPIFSEQDIFPTKDNNFHCINCIQSLFDLSEMFYHNTDEGYIEKTYVDPNLVISRLVMEAL